MRHSLILPLLLALPASPAGAVTTLFSGFESVTAPDLVRRGYATLAHAEGWTGGPAGIEVQANSIAGRAFSGRNLVELDSSRNSAMTLDLAPGRYVVSYWYSPRPGVAAASNAITLSLGTRLLDTISADGGRQTLWQQRSVAFHSTGGPLTFAAAGRSDSVGGYLDDISVIGSAVPELATWAMLVAGFLCIGIAARRRKPAMVVAR